MRAYLAIVKDWYAAFAAVGFAFYSLSAVVSGFAKDDNWRSQGELNSSTRRSNAFAQIAVLFLIAFALLTLGGCSYGYSTRLDPTPAAYPTVICRDARRC